MKKAVLFVITLINVVIVSAQTFYFHYATALDENMISIIEYSQSRYISVGHKGSDGIIFKIDNQGNLLKSIAIDSLGQNILLAYIYKLEDNKLLILGHIGCSKKLFFLNIDTNLNILSKKYFDLSIGNDSVVNYGKGLLDSDNNIMVTCFKGVSASPNIPFLLKFSSSGDFIQQSFLPKTYNMITYTSLIKSGNSYFLFLGVFIDNSYIYKLNSELEIDSIYRYSASGITYEGNVFGKNFTDTTFISAVTGFYAATQSYKVSIFEHDTNLNNLNDVSFGFLDGDLSLLSQSHALDFYDKNYIYLLGGTLLTCLDSNKTIRWQKQIVLNDSLLLWSDGIYATSDKGAIMLFGTEKSHTEDNSDITIVKIDSLGTVPLAIQEKYGIKLSDYKVYPNPASDYLKIFKAVQIPEAEFILYNTSGQIVLRKTLLHNTTEINVRDLPRGTYLYNIICNGKLADNGKIILNR